MSIIHTRALKAYLAGGMLFAMIFSLFGALRTGWGINSFMFSFLLHLSTFVVCVAMLHLCISALMRLKRAWLDKDA
ncbi:MAG: hypothetical protein RL693_1858 [Verrucomicrobiota bacterium]